MSTYVVVQYLGNYTKVLNYILDVQRESFKSDLHEGGDYKIEISYRIFMDDWKVTVLYYEVG